MPRHLPFLACLLAALLLVLVIIQNMEAVEVALAGRVLKVPLAAALAAAMAVGAATGFSAARFFKAGKPVAEMKIAEWDRQDARLAAEVKSDREKQLEAKIRTLESALDRALKKK